MLGSGLSPRFKQPCRPGADRTVTRPVAVRTFGICWAFEIGSKHLGFAHARKRCGGSRIYQMHSSFVVYIRVEYGSLIFRYRDGSWSPQSSKESHRTGPDFRGGPARFVHLQTRPKVAIPSNRASVSAGRMFALNPPHPARRRRSSTVGVSYKMHSSVGPRSRVLYGHVRWAVRSRLQSTATTAPGRDSLSVNPESGRPMACSYSNAPAPSHGPDPVIPSRLECKPDPALPMGRALIRGPRRKLSPPVRSARRSRRAGRLHRLPCAGRPAPPIRPPRPRPAAPARR